jgi:hypothetical protein
MVTQSSFFCAMINRWKSHLNEAMNSRFFNLLYLLLLVTLVLICFTKISSAIGLLSQNF